MDGVEDSMPTVPPQEHTPLFRAENEPRYVRQDAILNYEQDTGRSLVVFWGPILPLAITEFTDAIRDTPQGAPLAQKPILEPAQNSFHSNTEMVRFRHE